MVDSSVRFQPSTLPEAARILGVSESTVRRLVKAGKLEAERVLRPQGHVWMVRVPAPATDPPSEPPRWIGASPANPPGEPAAASATPSALASWMTAVLEPVMAELAVSRQQLVSQAETIGTLRAENRALLARTAPQPPDPTMGAPWTRWRAVSPLWLLPVGALVAVVVLLVR
jgi:excisionase family DNA binding protein